MPKQTADRVIDRPYSSAFRSGSGGVSVATSTSVPVHGLDSIYHTGTLDSRYYTEAECNILFVPTGRTISPGSGLSGGGALSSDLTLAVHRYTDSGLTFGMDGGLSLGTPISASVSSANSVTGVQHSHAITSSSNPGAAASLLATSASGALTLNNNSTTQPALIIGNGTIGRQAIGAAGWLDDGTEFRMLGSRNFRIPAVTQTTIESDDIFLGSNGGSTLYFRGNQLTGTGWGLTGAGYLTTTGAQFSGNVNVVSGGDLTVGANILFVDASGTNIGVNCAPDPQFDLDVEGNFRAKGFIVGKHAIQLDGALLIAHFDGAKKVADFSGEPNGHRGQVGTITGSKAFVPGKFGKGFTPSRAATNICQNPSAETNTTGTAASEGTVSRVSTESIYGDYCFRWARTLTNQWCSVTIAAQAAGTALYVQAWVRAQSGQSVSLILSDGSSFETTAATATGTGEWIFVSGSATVPATKTASRILFRVGGTNAFYFDAVQVTVGAAYPYFDGSMPGCSWAGTAHNSSSNKPATKLSYVATGNIDAYQGTFACWLKLPVAPNTSVSTQPGIFTWWDAFGTESMYLHFDSNHAAVRFVTYAGSALIANLGASISWAAGSWHHVAVTWSSYDNISRLFVDGVLAASGAFSAPAITSTVLTIGEQVSGRYLDGTIDEVVILDNPLAVDAVKAVYESNAPVFAETSNFQFRSGNSLVWADEEGLWMLDTAGVAVMGMSGVDSKSWGGSTLDTGDIQFGQYGATNGGWFRFNRDGVASKPLITLGYGTSTVAEFDNAGARISGIMDVTGTIRTKSGATVYTTLSNSGLVMTEQTDTVGFGYHAAASLRQGFMKMYSGAYNGFLPSTIARRTLIEQNYDQAGEYTQLALQTVAPPFSSNNNITTLTLQSSPDGTNFFEFKSAATNISYKAYINFQNMKFSTAAVGAYYGKVAVKIDNGSTFYAIPIYTY